MADDVSRKLAGAHKALDSANKFSKSAGDPGLFKDQHKAASYSQAHEARKDESSSSPKEFMGIHSDQATELNTALASRADAEKALGQ